MDIRNETKQGLGSFCTIDKYCTILFGGKLGPGYKAKAASQRGERVHSWGVGQPQGPAISPEIYCVCEPAGQCNFFTRVFPSHVVVEGHHQEVSVLLHLLPRHLDCSDADAV